MVVRDENTSTDALAIVEKYESFVTYLYPILQRCPRKHGVARDLVLAALFVPVGDLYHAAKSRQVKLFQIQNDGSGRERIGWHCEHVSEGCRNCYAERLNLRLGTRRDFKPGELYRPEREGGSLPLPLAQANRSGARNGEVKLFLDDRMLTQPLRWKKPRMIFVCSMSDLFADFVPDAWIDRVFAVMALCPQHVFQVLTKRPERMRAWMTKDRTRSAPVECIAELYVEHPDLAARWPFDKALAIEVGTRGWPLPNVWLGTSVEDQVTADTRIPYLLSTPAALRFISAEPLLGPIDLTNLGGPGSAKSYGAHGFSAIWRHNHIGRACLDWVIAGGESGPGARPMHPDWARSLRDQCKAAGVAYFFKQWGEWSPGGEAADLRVPAGEIFHDPAISPDFYAGRGGYLPAVTMMRLGKHAAGRLLDGVTHDAFPQPKPPDRS